MTQRLARCLRGGLWTALALGAGWLFLRYLLPWGAPLLIALGVAALLEPAVSRLRRLGLPRGAAAGLLTLLALGTLAGLLFLAVARLAAEASELAAAAPELLGRLADALADLEARLLDWADAAPGGVGGFLVAALDALAASAAALPGEVSERLLRLTARLAQATPGALLFLLTAGMGAYFLSASWPEAMAFARAQIPARFHRRLREARRELGESLGGLLRAQLLLTLLTFAALLAAFSLLRLRGALALALGIALLDALPVLGAGAALLPWALVCLATGSARLGLGLALTWAAVSLLRACLQPKLLGDQLGLHPVVSLAALYAGWSACGVWGMLLFPVLAVFAVRLNERGVLRLWRREEEH